MAFPFISLKHSDDIYTKIFLNINIKVNIDLSIKCLFFFGYRLSCNTPGRADKLLHLFCLQGLVCYNK